MTLMIPFLGGLAGLSCHLLLELPISTAIGWIGIFGTYTHCLQRMNTYSMAVKTTFNYLIIIG